MKNENRYESTNLNFVALRKGDGFDIKCYMYNPEDVGFYSLESNQLKLKSNYLTSQELSELANLLEQIEHDYQLS